MEQTTGIHPVKRITDLRPVTQVESRQHDRNQAQPNAAVGETRDPRTIANRKCGTA
jgi:hypothetical protein